LLKLIEVLTETNDHRIQQALYTVLMNEIVRRSDKLQVSQVVDALFHIGKHCTAEFLTDTYNIVQERQNVDCLSILKLLKTFCLVGPPNSSDKIESLIQQLSSFDLE
jgi:hypothetical protein